MQFASKKNYALIIAVIASFITPFVGSSINVALPSIASEFHINAILLSWIPTSYLLSLAVFLVPFGRIADIWGRKRIFTYGITIFTIASFISIFSVSGEMLIILRIFQGLGSAMIFGNLFAIIASVFPEKERGRAFGITIVGVFLGLFLGPVLGGILTQYFGWRSIFLFNVPIGVISIISVLRLKGEWAYAKGEKFDIIGSIILGITLILIMYGFSILPDIYGGILILAGFIGFLTFIMVEKRIESPVIDINIFKNRSFTSNNIAAFINYSSAMSIIFLLSLYLQYIKDFNPQDAGLILSVQPICMTVFSPFAGNLSDKMAPEKVASVGMGIASLGLITFSVINENTSVGVIVLGLILIGIGFALFSSPNTNAVISSIEEKQYGVASATLSTMRVMGQMFGMGITMLVLALLFGNTDIAGGNNRLFLESSKIIFAIFAFLSFIGVFLSLVKNK
ncbi:MAG: MFS transporter [Methanobacterium sp.]|uniref:MFS transporter n=1 Tax=Methanobacterium sp. TaxID=2164 RepID=UPI003D65B351|nr:MFS transporter [Methanobacterium sp.]